MSIHAGASRPPRLILRFAMYSAVALLLAGAGIFWFARHEAESRSQREVLERAQTTSMLLEDRFEPSDFAGPVGATRRSELDHMFGHVVHGEVVRVKLWSPDGTITYSNDPTLIGTSHARAEIADVLSGDAKSEIGRLNDEGGTGEDIRVLSAYVPVRTGSSEAPIGALELYTSFDEVNADAMAALKRVSIALALALLLLYASLFPILRQVTGALEARTRRLQQQSDELEKTIAERKQALVGLREADARYRALVEELPLVSYVSALDTPGLSTYVSPQLENLLGYTPEEWLATPGLFWDVIHPDDAERVREEHRIGYANAETFSTQYRMRGKDGRDIWVEDQIRVIPDSDRNPTLAQGFLIDITERKRAEQERSVFTRELEIQNERLLELDRLKDEFVALVSHELRTPLTSIRGYLELVLDGEAGDVTDEQRQFLGVVERNANRLLDLVGDLLFLAQIEAGKLSLEVGAVDLGAVAAESVETARPLAEEKDITLTLATSPVPLLAGDGARLAQLLDNLVSNAVKFTPEGGRVDVRASSSRGNAILEVRDTGMGIPAEEQKHVFERFFRTSRATEQAIQGTGLGLAISKAIVHAHGGRITLASSEGEGATFRVTIPIRAVQPAEPEQEEIAS